MKRLGPRRDFLHDLQGRGIHGDCGRTGHLEMAIPYRRQGRCGQDRGQAQSARHPAGPASDRSGTKKSRTAVSPLQDSSATSRQEVLRNYKKLALHNDIAHMYDNGARKNPGLIFLHVRNPLHRPLWVLFGPTASHLHPVSLPCRSSSSAFDMVRVHASAMTARSLPTITPPGRK